MTINIKASTIPEGTDANAVAGASAGEMHELTNKLHATVCFFFSFHACRRRHVEDFFFNLTFLSLSLLLLPFLFPLYLQESGYEMKLDAMGAETAEDVELAVVVGGGAEGEGEGQGGDAAAKTKTKMKKRDLVVKVGSCRRSFVSLPEDADETSVEGTLGDGAFTVRCGKK